MSNTLHLSRREQDGSQLTPAMYKLLVALLVLFIVALLLVAALLFLRRRRRSTASSELPMYSEKRTSTASTSSHHRRNHARPSHSIHIYHDKPDADEKSSRPSTPGSPVPEIRITFPEEFDDSGKRHSGRVVVVHVGDSGVGMSPVDEKLPPYDTEAGRMQSVDLERVGGLVENARNKPLGW